MQGGISKEQDLVGSIREAILLHFNTLDDMPASSFLLSVTQTVFYCSFSEHMLRKIDREMRHSGKSRS